MAEKKKSSKQEEVKNKELEVIDPIYEKYVKSVIRALGSTKFYEFFMDSISRAENEFQFSNRRLEKYVDTTWVDAIEESLEAFQNIVSSPRNVIKEEEFIVNVANAKKGGSDVVRHLATHASLVEDYNEETGDVRPERLMQKYRDDTMGIYENRLVYTALEYAHQFVKIRHDALFQSMGEEFGAKLKLKSDMYSATENVHLDMFLHITDSDGALDIDEKNREIFDRISRIYRILSMHMTTRFAVHMARRPRISGALMKTNVLKKDPNYRKIVKLWEFLTSYENVGYTIKVIEQNPYINENFERDIYHNILFNYLVLKGHLERDKDRLLPQPLKEKKRTLKPKFIKQIIEELTEDYDLPDIEIRKVLIEELTKEQLMLEEEAERRRLVEEQEQRRLAEEERLRQEEEAEKERLRLEREAEEELKRQQKEAEEARLLLERMEREQEIRRRSGLFRAETESFFANLEERLNMRADAAEETVDETQDFEDAVSVMEETERLKKEEAERARQRKREELERQRYEEMLEKQRLEREEAERQEKLRQEEEALRAKLLMEQRERDMKKVAPYKQELEDLVASVSSQIQRRLDIAEVERAKAEARELERRRRNEERKSSGT